MGDNEATTWGRLADGEGESRPSAFKWRWEEGKGRVRDSTCDLCGQPVVVDYAENLQEPHLHQKGKACAGSRLRSMDEGGLYESVGTVNGGLPTLGKNRR